MNRKPHSEETKQKLRAKAIIRCNQPWWRKRHSDALSTPLPEGKVAELYAAGFTQKEIADQLNTTQAVICRHMRKHGIKARSKSENGLAQPRGEDSSSWKGGKTIGPQGYVWIRCSGHPRANKCGGYVPVHVLVMEQHLGRFLAWHGQGHPLSEVVHHINEDVSDNRLENLQVMTYSEHFKLHHRIRRERKLAAKAAAL